MRYRVVVVSRSMVMFLLASLIPGHVKVGSPFHRALYTSYVKIYCSIMYKTRHAW